MGCGSSNATSAAEPNNNITEFAVYARQVKQTWPDIKNIDKLGAKTFAYLLHKYPEFKTFYHIPEAYKTEADLLNADEVKEPGERFIAWYSDIIENSDTKFDEKLREHAIQLNNQGVRATQVKNYGDSLIHVISYELKNGLTVEEKRSWQLFCTQVSNGLAVELAKFPRKSIV
ncbi:unnamed protein product [Adineta steineri]|uniref:Globin domain-containing protein n=1 Tax=Adineta steineri TaxID=433720 RepID=A0A814FZI8_9BILA|nr:unnamed protein product [Adineta steineri]CAF3626912.1 unnamed protein product [Adineta steineri]